MASKQENLKKLLAPRHIVFIGNKKIVRTGIRNCHKIGYSGEIYVVHQNEHKIEGYTCYNSVSALPVVPDAAFIAVRGDKTIAIVRELAEQGTAGCVAYAAGFSEIGAKDLQTDLVQAAGDMALVGPNCYGVLNFFDQVSLWPDRHGGKTVSNGVAIISQSGNMSMNLTMTDRSLPLGYIVSVGNQAVLGIGDYVEAFCQDPRVAAIGLHIEGLDNVEQFSRAARLALEKGVPLVALKTGISEQGTELTMSHTSSLAGSDELYQALFDRLNICRVDSPSSLIETLKLFAVTGPLKGRRLGVLSGSGGESAFFADLAAQKGFTLPKLDDSQVKDLKKQLSTFEHVSNPLDYNTSIWGDELKLVQCFTTFMKGGFDATVLILDFLAPDTGDVQAWEAAINALTTVHKRNGHPTVVVATLPEGLPVHVREHLMHHGITPLQGISEAFIAFDCAASYYLRRNHCIAANRNVQTELLLPAYSPAIDASFLLNEWEGKQALRAYGLRVPKGQLVCATEASKVTETFNGPFVVKAVSDKIPHKTEVGGVILNVQDAMGVAEAVERIFANLSGIQDNENRFLVEEMILNPVAELMIGLKRDNQFGLALVIGMGGEFVNLLNDNATLLLPTDEEAIVDALNSIKGVKLLEGYRGRAKGDIHAVVEAVKAVAAYAEANRDNLLELDVNPLLVLPEGQGAVAADVLIRLAINEQNEIA